MTRALVLLFQEEPDPGSYDPREIARPLTQAKKSPAFMSSAQRSDRIATKFFTGNFVSRNVMDKKTSIIGTYYTV